MTEPNTVESEQDCCNCHNGTLRLLTKLGEEYAPCGCTCHGELISSD